MTDYANFRQRLDAVLRTRDVKQVQGFLIAEKQWQAGEPADPEFAMRMVATQRHPVYTDSLKSCIIRRIQYIYRLFVFLLRKAIHAWFKHRRRIHFCLLPIGIDTTNGYGI